MFSNLSQGSLVYVLSMNNGLKYNTGIIESIVYDNNQLTYNPLQNNKTLSIKVNINGKSVEIKGVLANCSVSSNTSYIITDSKEGMINQIESLSQNSKTILENIDYHKKVIEECDEILLRINPTFAKENERDKAIGDLNGRIDDLAVKLDKVLKTLIKEE